MNERDEDLLAGLALDALDTDAEFHEALRLSRSGPEAARTLREHRETAAALALAAAAPPPAHVKEAVLARIAALEVPDAGGPAPGPSVAFPAPAAAPQGPPAAPQEKNAAPDVVPFRPRRRATVWLAAAAAAAVLVAVPAVGVAINQHQRAVVAEETNAQITRLLSQPGAAVTSAQLSQGGSLTVVNAAGESALITRGMAHPGEGKTYQLWTIDAGQAPRSAGLVTDASAITAASALAKGTVVAVTLEPSGGSAQPSGQPLAAVTVG